MATIQSPQGSTTAIGAAGAVTTSAAKAASGTRMETLAQANASAARKALRGRRPLRKHHEGAAAVHRDRRGGGRGIGRDGGRGDPGGVRGLRLLHREPGAPDTRDGAGDRSQPYPGQVGQELLGCRRLPPAMQDAQ